MVKWDEIKAEAAEIVMNEAEAREITSKINLSLDSTWDLIIEAWLGRADVALGYESWDAYTKAEFGTDRIKLPASKRLEVVASMRKSMPVSVIAPALNVNPETIRRDLQKIDPPIVVPATTPTNVEVVAPATIGIVEPPRLPADLQPVVEVPADVSIEEYSLTLVTELDNWGWTARTYTPEVVASLQARPQQQETWLRHLKECQGIINRYVEAIEKGLMP